MIDHARQGKARQGKARRHRFHHLGIGLDIPHFVARELDLFILGDSQLARVFCGVTCHPSVHPHRRVTVLAVRSTHRNAVLLFTHLRHGKAFLLFWFCYYGSVVSLVDSGSTSEGRRRWMWVYYDNIEHYSGRRIEKWGGEKDLKLLLLRHKEEETEEKKKKKKKRRKEEKKKKEDEKMRR
jgi:hypothetical protein